MDLFRNILMIQRKNTAIEIFEENQCEFVKDLGAGAFGEVFAVKDPNDRQFAVKVFGAESCDIGEISLWPLMKHPNIQPLFHIFQFADIFICTMPIQYSTLGSFVKDHDFLHEPMAFYQIKKWFKDILIGLQYLQFHKLSHLDIKSDNVLISNEYRAIICDFNFLTPSAQPIEKRGTPFLYTPPECSKMQHIEKIEGLYFDSWTTGVMFLDCLTNKAYTSTVNLQQLQWVDTRYMTLFRILQQNTFYELISQTFPSANLNKTKQRFVRNFILMFLKFNPEKRPTAEKALTHKFFSIQTGSIYSEDIIWREKANISWMDDFVSSYRTKLETKVFPDECNCEMCVKSSNDSALDHIIHINRDEAVDFSTPEVLDGH